MKLLRNLNNLDPSLRRGAVSIGNFDGVHRGHARIVERLVERAAQLGRAAVVFTFEPHPVRILRPEQAPPPLTWTERKAELLAQLGVDAVVAYPTDASLLALPAEEFFQRIVREQLDARVLVEGPNFRFGRARAGDVELLRRLCDHADMQLDVVEPVMLDGAIVSSSRVREAIQSGEIELANRMLTQPYRIRGMVVHGTGRGAKLGFPTANLDAIDTLLPALGVYAARAITGQRCWPAAVHIGPNPTFGESSVKVEVHVIGFDGVLYGQPLEVDFLARLRGVERFGSPEQLRDRLLRDVAQAREIAMAHGCTERIHDE